LNPKIITHMVRSMIAEPKINVMTKKHRRRNPNSNTDNWGGLTGGVESNGHSDGGVAY